MNLEQFLFLPTNQPSLHIYNICTVNCYILMYKHVQASSILYENVRHPRLCLFSTFWHFSMLNNSKLNKKNTFYKIRIYNIFQYGHIWSLEPAQFLLFFKVNINQQRDKILQNFYEHSIKFILLEASQSKHSIILYCDAIHLSSLFFAILRFTRYIFWEIFVTFLFLENFYFSRSHLNGPQEVPLQ